MWPSLFISAASTLLMFLKHQKYSSENPSYFTGVTLHTTARIICQAVCFSLGWNDPTTHSFPYKNISTSIMACAERKWGNYCEEKKKKSTSNTSALKAWETLSLWQQFLPLEIQRNTKTNMTCMLVSRCSTFQQWQSECCSIMASR